MKGKSKRKRGQSRGSFPPQGFFQDESDAAATEYAVMLTTIMLCVISIAGVSNPVDFVKDAWGQAKKARKAQIGWNLEGGIPEKRAKEIQVPVLLFHGNVDVNVDIKHSENMYKALRRAKKDVEFVEYEDADHHIEFERKRIDMLQRIGDFLHEHLKRDVRSPS